MISLLCLVELHPVLHSGAAARFDENTEAFVTALGSFRDKIAQSSKGRVCHSDHCVTKLSDTLGESQRATVGRGKRVGAPGETCRRLGVSAYRRDAGLTFRREPFISAFVEMSSYIPHAETPTRFPPARPNADTFLFPCLQFVYYSAWVEFCCYRTKSQTR